MTRAGRGPTCDAVADDSETFMGTLDEALEASSTYQKIEAIGVAEGRVEGRAEGKQIGEADALVRQAARRLGRPPAAVRSRVRVAVVAGKFDAVEEHLAAIRSWDAFADVWGPAMAAGRITIVDSHTGGEPTRVVVAGGPDLGRGPLVDRRRRFADYYDAFRSTVANEPRGSDTTVGALLVEPVDPASAAGVVFFNNVGVLNMCGHGTIGLAVTLGHLGRLAAGTHRVETPVGVVSVEFDGRNVAAVDNVPSYRHAAGVTIDVPGLGPVAGDVAWGGNWFFLAHGDFGPLTLAHVERLTDVTWRIREALAAAGVSGADGGEIDHVELFGPPADPANDSRNFVLCPGKAYDRSPCGTGTSAKLACLYADGMLRPGDLWRQESILGSVFEGSVRVEGGVVHPRIKGTAYVTAESTLLVDPADPFKHGIRG